MAYIKNIFHFITMRRVCLVLGIVNAIANLLLLMWYSLVWFLLLAIGDVRSAFTFDAREYREWISESFTYVVVPLAVSFNFIFCVLLCNGICATQPRQVKAYLVYGISVTIMASLVGVMLLSCDSQQLGLRRYTDPTADMAYNIACGIWWLVGCAVHSLFLVLVHRTHIQLVEELESVNYVHLVELGSTKQRF